MILGHWVKFGFVNHFDSHFFSSEHMTGKFHNSKMSSSKCFFQIIESSNFGWMAITWSTSQSAHPEIDEKKLYNIFLFFALLEVQINKPNLSNGQY